jgi:1-acyl-sn-glycerol-3-phosphate acyltransferase
MSLLEPLTRVDTAWSVARLVAPRMTLLLAPAAAYGVERVPAEGGAVVAANHFSGIDHPLIGSFSPRPLRFLAKAELLEIAGLGPLLRWLGVFGVRRGEGDRDALRRARELVRDGELVGVHLEGTRQPFGHPGPMLPGGLMIAMQEGAPVIPCGIDTFGWSPRNRRLCAVVWGEPMRLDELPRNRKGYADAAERVGTEIVRLWRLAVQAAAAGLPEELPDGSRRSGINPRL